MAKMAGGRVEVLSKRDEGKREREREGRKERKTEETEGKGRKREGKRERENVYRFLLSVFVIWLGILSQLLKFHE